MVPPAALCIHLCIGQAYAFSVFNLPMTKLIGITKSAPGRLEADRSRLDLLDRHLLPRGVGGGARPLGRGRRAAPRDVRRGFVLRRRVSRQRLRGVGPSALDRLSRLWRARRHRLGPRLHFARVDADQMVSRPARHGDRHGDHGLRRRGHDRCAAVGLADERLLDADACRGRRDFCRDGVGLRLLHAGRRGDRSAAGAGMEARRVRALDPAQEARHQQRRLRLSGVEDAAVLADLDRALHERDGGHRRARAKLRR